LIFRYCESFPKPQAAADAAEVAAVGAAEAGAQVSTNEPVAGICSGTQVVGSTLQRNVVGAP